MITFWQFLIALAWGIGLFILGDNPHMPGNQILVLAIISLFLLKGTMFVYVWIRHGLAAARSVRIDDQDPRIRPLKSYWDYERRKRQ